jgi:hypothetical protein
LAPLFNPLDMLAENGEESTIFCALHTDQALRKYQ